VHGSSAKPWRKRWHFLLLRFAVSAMTATTSLSPGLVHSRLAEGTFPSASVAPPVPDLPRDLGRVAIGLGLMILSLHILLDTLAPGENAPSVRALLAAIIG
jgi:hypothetical protein